MGILKVYKQFIKKNIKTVFIIIIFGELLANAINLMILPLYKEAVENSLTNSGSEFILSVITKALLVIVLYLLSMYILKIFYPKFLIRCSKYLRSKFIDYIIHLKYCDIEYYSTGDYLKAFEKLDLISSYSFKIVSCVIKGFFIIALNMYLIIYIHWIMIIILFGLMIVIIMNQNLLKPLKNQQEEIWEKEGITLLMIDSEVQNLPLIKSFMLGTKLENIFNMHMNHIISLEKRRILLSNLIQTMQQVTKFVILIATPLICWVLINQNLVNVSTVILASFSFSLMSNAIIELIQGIVDITKIKSAVTLIDRYMDKDYLKERDITYRIPNNEFNGIRIEDLNFQYNTRTIFEHCSLTLPKNGLVIMIGESGSGKSTFLKLLAAQLFPDHGDILINHKYELVSAIDSISLATQDTILFSGTVRENIQIGNMDSGNEEINHVVDLLSVKNSIEELKYGLNTIVNSEGNNLSGGQKQIVNLCRAFCKDSSVILLDEPTSSQSPENEQIIIRSIKKISAEKLVVIVTHSQAVIDLADIKYRVQDKRLEVIV